MKVINTGDTYNIYNDNLKTFDKFPAQVYRIVFSPLSGFSCVKFNDIVIKEKIYGVHKAKAEKSLNAFERSVKNLGVILSGPKGIGKSVTAKIICNLAVTRGYPVFIVDSYSPGIANYLDSIDQECLILFDEFDKTFFSSHDDSDSMSDPQTEMLTLFDGINSSTKKMFVITANEIYRLNDFLVNRPGRFHYHFRFNNPSADEIRQYMEEKLNEAYWSEIDKVISFSRRVDINYDCLRAICSELETGEKFEDAICDLNIVNIDDPEFNIEVHFKNGLIATDVEEIDMFSEDSMSIPVYDGSKFIGRFAFVPNTCKYSPVDGAYIADLEDKSVAMEIESSYINATEDDESGCIHIYGEKLTSVIEKVIFRKKSSTNLIHYVV